MKLETREATPENEYDAACVTHAAAEIVRARGDACDPVLHKLTRGEWDEELQIGLCVNGDEPAGMIVLAGNSGNNGIRAMGMKLTKGLTARQAAQVSSELLGFAVAICLMERIGALSVDLNSSMPGLEPLLEAKGFRPGTRRGIWEYPGDLRESAAAAPAYGQGDWSVVLYNDEETTTDVVVGAIMCGVGVNQSWATQLMIKVHVTGHAAVSLHYFEWSARRTQLRIQGYFHRHGFSTRVEIEKAASACSART